jgi:nicotinamide phosphoribosyltransferase
MPTDNLLLLTDSYKPTHPDQFPPGTTGVFSYFASRGGTYDHVDFVGLQYLIYRRLTRGFALGDVSEAEDFYHQHFGTRLFRADLWRKVYERYAGDLPMEIRAVPEGSRVPTGVPAFTVRSLDASFAPLLGSLEPLFAHAWYPSTVATQAGEERAAVLRWLEVTGDPATIDYKVHDFGLRGASSVESAAIGGLGHLLWFKGTDTVPALALARDYYGCPMAGHSIFATEHSTMTSWGRDGELDAYRNVLRVARERSLPLYAAVSDSYDLFHAIGELWGGALRDEVLAMNGTLVLRPDSGNMLEVVPAAIRLAMDRFGYTTNEKGFTVLPPQVRFIQGDGIDGPKSIHELYRALWRAGISADNLAVGEGGGKLQKVNRDTLKFKFAASSVVVDGERRAIAKDPLTDPGKRSLAGEVTTFRDHVRDGSGRYVLRVGLEAERKYGGDAMQTVFDVGHVPETQTLDEMRERARLERRYAEELEAERVAA